VKKIQLIFISLLLISFLAGCTSEQEAGVDDALVATQVSIVLTQTALEETAETEPVPVDTATTAPTHTATQEASTPTVTETLTPTVTATLDDSDPAVSLGEPVWVQDFTAGSSPWDFDSDQAVFKTQEGALTLTAKGSANWHSWYVSTPKLRNAYLEAKIEMSTCSGLDRIGLAVRSATDGQQFYFMGITCDGQWGFFRMAPDVNIKEIIGFQETDLLTDMVNIQHRAGIWMNGNDFTLYIDGQKVGTAADDTLSGEGYTGFLIAYDKTPGFSVKVDELKYWNLP
jgi:hypothetical protein